MGAFIEAVCCTQVKRKDPPEAAVPGDSKRARPSTPVDDELEDEGEPLLGMFCRQNITRIHLFQMLIHLLGYTGQTEIETLLSSPRVILK